MRTIVIDPVTRIEGHAKIDIHLDADGQVANTVFHVTQVRGFEKFIEGRGTRRVTSDGELFDKLPRFRIPGSPKCLTKIGFSTAKESGPIAAT